MPKHQAAKVRRWQATLIITLFFLAFAGAAALGWWYARESPPHQGPIVLIAADGLPAMALPVYGGRGVDARGIDALAADSVVFERAYAQSAQVLPAHASLISGQLPPDHGVRDDAGFVLKPEVRTLAELLRSRGFNTAAVLASAWLRREAGVAQGFTFFAAGPDVTSSEYESGSVVDAAERWARTQGNQRYFLLVQVDEADADAAVSRLTQLLKERRLYDKATIVLVGERGKTGGGSWLDDATLHVPLIIKQPESEAAGRRISDPVQQIDLLPTILDFVRAPIPGGLRGRSLRAAIDDDGVIPPQPLYAESLAAYYRFGASPVFSIAANGFRYVLNGLPRAEPRAEEQVSPLGGAAPAGDAPIEQLRAALDRLLSGKPLPNPAPVAPADEERLALMGYLPTLPPAPGKDEPLDSTDEERIAEAHHAAAMLAGDRMFAAAVASLQRIVAEHPMLATVHYQIGLLLARSGRWDEAVAPLTTAAELRPETVEVPLALADVLARAGRNDEANEQIARAIAVATPMGGTRSADVHALAARIALAQQDRESAAMHADAALAANPGLPIPQFVRGRVALDEARYDAALTAFREAIATTREHQTTVPDLHLSLADTLAHLEQYGEAETEYREELGLYPRNLQAYGSLAMLYHAAKRDADVEDVLTELVESVPTPEGYALAARLWTVIGERPRAEALRSEARSRFRGDPSLALLGRDARR